MTPTISATPRFIVRRNRPSRTVGYRNGRAHEGQVSADRDTAWPQSGHGTSEFADMGPRHGFGPSLQASVPTGTGHALMGSILPPIAGVTGPDPVGRRRRARTVLLPSILRTEEAIATASRF